MKLQTLLILILAVALLVSLFFNFDSSEVLRDLKRDKERDKAILLQKDENIRQLISDFHEQELKALQAIQQEKLRADQTQEKLTIANEKLKSVVFRHSRNDRERDSILRATLHP